MSRGRRARRMLMRWWRYIDSVERTGGYSMVSERSAFDRLVKKIVVRRERTAIGELRAFHDNTDTSVQLAASDGVWEPSVGQAHVAVGPDSSEAGEGER